MNYRKSRILLLFVTICILLAACNQSEQTGEVDQSTTAAEKYLQAVGLYQEGKLDEAKVLLEESIKQEPDNGIYDFYLGNVYRRQKDIEKALENYQNAVKKTPEMVEAYNNIAAIQMNSQKYDEALETVNKGLAQQADDTELKFKKAQILFVKKQHQESIALLNDLAKQPSYFEAHRFLGLNYAQLNDKAKALEHLKVYLQLAPEGVQFKENVKKIVAELEKK